MAREIRKKGPVKQESKKVGKTPPRKVKKETPSSKLAAKDKEIAALREEIILLKAECQGKLAEQNMNTMAKLDTMLGQILYGLFLVGIMPNAIQRKCEQMFHKARKETCA